MVKVAFFCYHKNVYSIYKPEWISQYRDSVLNQTFKEFDVFEINYGKGQERIFEHSNFESIEFPTFTHALNHLFFKATMGGYYCAANSNVDDWFSENRLEKQLPYINEGYDIVTSNFSLVENDQTIKTHSFDKLSIENELYNNHNIICHPSIIYSRKYMEENRYVPDEMPFEDLKLWQRTIRNYKFIILPEVLCFHRLHNQSVCQSENK